MSRGRTFILAATGTLTGLAFALATGVGAQTVDGLDLAKVRARAAVNAADAESLARTVAKRGDALRDEAVATAAASRARLREANVFGPTVKGGVLDFDAMVASAGKAAEPDETPRLIAFASLSMPQASLKAMIADVSKAGGVVVFRGLPGNSAKIFTTAIAKVLPAGEDSSVGIDPRLFRAFRVEAVPAYVVTANGLRSLRRVRLHHRAPAARPGVGQCHHAFCPRHHRRWRRARCAAVAQVYRARIDERRRVMRNNRPYEVALVLAMLGLGVSVGRAQTSETAAARAEGKAFATEIGKAAQDATSEPHPIRPVCPRRRPRQMAGLCLPTRTV